MQSLLGRATLLETSLTPRPSLEQEQQREREGEEKEKEDDWMLAEIQRELAEIAPEISASLIGYDLSHK